ncbi:hypothetical protein AALP_AA8G447500 [Arabis alpina]|uniref:Uncharacterized protein n=1 Tax=Arabis alpina TaxID=50452 RepID=A0A087GDH0_ARAAL|nr:hypothetical protein AALP_AA8G447500 [Arabis alpina]
MLPVHIHHYSTWILRVFCVRDPNKSCSHSDKPDAKSRVTMVPSAVAVSSSARLAMFRNTSSRVARPSWMSEIPNSDSLFCSSSKNPCSWRNTMMNIIDR